MDIIDYCEELLESLNEVPYEETPSKINAGGSTSNGLINNTLSMFDDKKEEPKIEPPKITPELKGSKLAEKYHEIVDLVQRRIEEQTGHSDEPTFVNTKKKIYFEVADTIASRLAADIESGARDGLWWQPRMDEANELLIELKYLENKYKIDKNEIEAYHKTKVEEHNKWINHFNSRFPRHWLRGVEDGQ